MTEPATLHAYGRVKWEDLAQAVAGVPTAWADYTGFHVKAVPSVAPPYTHLWAWSPPWRLRARLDGQHAIIGVLALDGPEIAGPPGLTPVESSLVRYVRREAHTWPGGERRVGPLADEVADHSVELYQLDGEYPLTFVALRDR